ncbi:MAG: hypothetical protein CM1200mP41_32990 [Gammaproteobacteria bacterium]|nr:MAG: hypothetical protein CM1200mP41_32990 [Gammaproteobacteria bacterium]
MSTSNIELACKLISDYSFTNEEMLPFGRAQPGHFGGRHRGNKQAQMGSKVAVDAPMKKWINTLPA